MRILFALLPLLLLGGCVEDRTYSVSGSFTEDRADADLEEVQELARAHGGDAVIQESSPEQFTAGGLEQEDCEALRAVLLEKEYLDTVGACTAEGRGAYS